MRNPPQSHMCTINSIDDDDTYFFRVVFYDRILKKNTYKMFLGEINKLCIFLTSMVYIISPRAYVYLIVFYPALVNNTRYLSL